MLRSNADAFTDPTTPRGCMIVLAATNTTPGNDEVWDYLADWRRGDQAELQRRIERGRADGDVSPDANATALAAYFTTVLNGLAIQARDGASRQALHQVIDHAMTAWNANQA